VWNLCPKNKEWRGYVSEGFTQQLSPALRLAGEAGGHKVLVMGWLMWWDNGGVDRVPSLRERGFSPGRSHSFPLSLLH
jgi:hypothetical protein